jgi:hypothetical protein
MTSKIQPVQVFSNFRLTKPHFQLNAQLQAHAQYIRHTTFHIARRAMNMIYRINL